jgi:CRP/FNR family transcriptional regulator
VTDDRNELLRQVKAAMPSLAGLTPELDHELAAQVQTMHLPAGAPVFRPHEACPGFPIVLAGRVRVTRTLDNGRELLLYEIECGESCVMSTACLLGNSSHGAHGHCDTDVDLALLPRPLFDRLLAQHAPFRAEVFGLFADRLMRLMELVEAVGFQRLDQRLAAMLLGKGRHLSTSHEQLAQALGASRESVSRQLKHFESNGWVRLGRGAIEILDPRALRHLAGGAAPVSAVTDPAAPAQ